MPEQSPDPGRELIGGPRPRTSRRTTLAPDTFRVRAAAVESGPLAEARSAKKRLGIRRVAGGLLAGRGVRVRDPGADPADRRGRRRRTRRSPARRRASHLLGVDANGHDMVSRIVWGARNSLFIAVVLGRVRVHPRRDARGAVAGYFRGKIGRCPRLGDRHPAGLPAARARPLDRDVPRPHRVQRDGRARDRVHAGARADRRGRRRSSGPSASSSSLPGPREQSTFGSCSARSSPTSCRRCSRSRCSASPWSSSPKPASPSSAPA